MTCAYTNTYHVQNKDSVRSNAPFLAKVINFEFIAKKTSLRKNVNKKMQAISCLFLSLSLSRQLVYLCMCKIAFTFSQMCENTRHTTAILGPAILYLATCHCLMTFASIWYICIKTSAVLLRHCCNSRHPLPRSIADIKRCFIIHNPRHLKSG